MVLSNIVKILLKHNAIYFFKLSKYNIKKNSNDFV